MRSRIDPEGVLHAAARWILLVTLIYAPWYYGGTTEEGIRTSTYLLSGAIILFLVGLVFGVARQASRSTRGRVTLSARAHSRLNPLPVALSFLVLLLLVLGWWMVVNARSIYDSDEYLFVAVKNLIRTFPGSVDQAVSAAWMWRASTLLGTICLVAHAVQDPVWLLRLWRTLAAGGSSIALLGLVQKASGAPMIFWQTTERPVKTFFATFYYHGNAGAFLDLTLPLTIGLAMRSFSRRSSPAVRALWLTASVISVLATFANTSRMGQVLGAAIILALVLTWIRRGVGAVRHVEWSTALFGFLALIVAGFAVVQNSRFEQSIKRWEQLSGSVDRDARWSAARVAMKAVPDAGSAGFGPGTFQIVFPYYTANPTEALAGKWRYLHQDYLQTFLEWGWAGSLLWGGLFFGGILVALRNRLISSRSAEWLPRQRLLLMLVLLGLVSIAVYALVDFPLQVSSIQIYSAVLLGICWGSETWRAKSRQTGST